MDLNIAATLIIFRENPNACGMCRTVSPHLLPLTFSVPPFLSPLLHFPFSPPSPSNPSAPDYPPTDDETIVEIEPRPLQNLLHVDDIDSMCPLIDAKLCEINKDGSPALLTLCGKGPRSTLRLLQHGLAVSEMAVSELPGNPNAVWSVKKSREDEHDAYIVVSFVNATLVLSCVARTRTLPREPCGTALSVGGG